MKSIDYLLVAYFSKVRAELFKKGYIPISKTMYKEDNRDYGMAKGKIDRVINLLVERGEVKLELNYKGHPLVMLRMQPKKVTK